MKLNETIVSVGIILVMILYMTWQSNQIDKLSESVTKLEKDKSSLTEQLSRQSSITENANRTFRIINNVSLLNSEDRNRSAVASEKVKTIIKTVLVDNECAPLDAPRDATIKLHNHANRIRSNAISTHSSSLAK